MNLSELSARSGMTTAAIKFYRREGLLPAGKRITATRQDYGDLHLARLDLISTLRTVAGLGIPEIRSITTLIDDGAGMVDVVGATHRAVLGLPSLDEGDAGQPEHQTVSELVHLLGWPDGASPARQALSSHLHHMALLGVQPNVTTLCDYATALDSIAAQNIGELTQLTGLDDAARAVAVGAATQYRLITLVLALAQTSRTIAASEGPPSAAGEAPL